jgi:hypothetical protein
MNDETDELKMQTRIISNLLVCEYTILVYWAR